MVEKKVFPAMPHVDSRSISIPKASFGSLQTSATRVTPDFNERIELLPPSRGAFAGRSRRGLERQASATTGAAFRAAARDALVAVEYDAAARAAGAVQSAACKPAVPAAVQYNAAAFPDAGAVESAARQPAARQPPPANPRPPTPPANPRPPTRPGAARVTGRPSRRFGANEQASRAKSGTEMENLDLRKHLILQDRALVALARLRPIS